MKYIPLLTLLASIAVVPVPVVSAQDSSDAMRQVRENALADKARAGAARRQQAAAQNQMRQRNVNPGEGRRRNMNPGRAGRESSAPGFVRNRRGAADRSGAGRSRIQPITPQIQSNVNRTFTGNRSGRSGNVDASRRYRNFDRGNRGNRGSEFNATRRNRQGNQDGNGNVRRSRSGGDRESFRTHRGGRHGHWDRSRRNRSWWRNHYTRFALFGGGYYYWNAGYWYPAYGYDPYFSTYVYDAPIYGYNDLEPGEVIARVQAELQRLGYDPGSVDGDFGPATREAVVAFQQDNGLPVTGEIDEDTLGALGLE